MKSFYEQDYNYGDEGVIDQDDGYYYWQDADCNEALQYICESGIHFNHSCYGLSIPMCWANLL